MKKFRGILLITMLSAFMMFILGGCGEKIALSEKTVEGVTLLVPSDFGEFAASDTGMTLATNEKNTASIGATALMSADGITPDLFDEETYAESALAGYTDVEFVAFDTAGDLDGVPALVAHVKGKNPGGTAVEQYAYILFREDGTMQNIAISFTSGAKSSLEENIDEIVKSISLK